VRSLVVVSPCARQNADLQKRLADLEIEVNRPVGLSIGTAR